MLSAEIPADSIKTVTENSLKINIPRKMVHRYRLNLINMREMSQELVKMRVITAGTLLEEKTEIGNGEGDLQRLAKTFKFSNQIQKFKLFCQCQNLTTRDLQTIAKGLKAMKCLKNVSVDLIDSRKFTDDGLYSLGKALKMLPCLKKLRLDFVCHKLTHSGFQSVIKDFKALSSLEHLHLGFDKPIDATFTSLKKTLKKFRSLKALELDFLCSEDITDEAVKILCETLQKFTSLKHLSVNFGSCDQITDIALCFLSEGIRKLSFLQSLSLLFPDYQFDWEKPDNITDIGFQNICELLRTLASLQRIHLDFYHHPQVNDTLMEVLNESLERLNFLKDISLNFCGCYKITDRGLQGVIQTLGKLISLKKIALDFGFCPEITGIAFEKMSDWEALTSLEDLTLTMSQCHQLNDQSLQYVSKALQKISSLQAVHINFKHWSSISQEGKANFIESLKESKFLKDIKL